MKFNVIFDIFAVSIIACAVFCLSGCSMFKPGTAERMEVVAIEDGVKLLEDEAKELGQDIVVPSPPSKLKAKKGVCLNCVKVDKITKSHEKCVCGYSGKPCVCGYSEQESLKKCHCHSDDPFAPCDCISSVKANKNAKRYTKAKNKVCLNC